MGELIYFVCRNIFEDRTLSWAAKGLYAWLNSIDELDEDCLRISDIVALVPAEYQDEARRAVEELSARGYIAVDDSTDS